MLLFHARRSHRRETGRPTLTDHGTSAAGSPLDHPKDVLYAQVYDPLTREWFAALDESKRTGDLVRQAAGRGLLRTMLDLNRLFHRLVDQVLNHPRVDSTTIVSTTQQHQDHVLWVGHAAPLAVGGFGLCVVV